MSSKSAPTSPQSGAVPTLRRPQGLSPSLIAKTLLSTKSSSSPKGTHSSRSGREGAITEASRERASSAGEALEKHATSPIVRHSWTEEVERNAMKRKPRPSSLPRSFSSSPDVPPPDAITRSRTGSSGSIDGANIATRSRTPLSPSGLRTTTLADDKAFEHSSTGGSPRLAARTIGNEVADLRIDETKMLGKGNFGVVYEGTLNRRRVAVKVLKRPNIESLELELQSLRRIRSTNCVLFLEYFPRKSALVMEYMGGGSLHSLLHSVGSDGKNSLMLKCPLSKRLRVKIALDIAEGLVYLHSLPMLHRDLTSGNVLLTRRLDTSDFSSSAVIDEDSPIAKISDFGLARRGKEYASAATGHLLYVAPEVYDNTGAHTQSSDIYSFGILLYEIFSRQVPYPGLNPSQAAIRAAGDGLRPNHLKNPLTELVPDVILLLSERCWATPAKSRVASTKCADSLKSLLRLMSSCVVATASKRTVKPDDVLSLLEQRGIGARYFSGNVREAAKCAQDTSSIIICISEETFDDDGICKLIAECILQKKQFLCLAMAAPPITTSSGDQLTMKAIDNISKKKPHTVGLFEAIRKQVRTSPGSMPIVIWPLDSSDDNDSGVSSLMKEVSANQVIKVLSEVVEPVEYSEELTHAALACNQVYDSVLL